MQLKESQNQLREQIILAGSGKVISAFSSKYPAGSSERKYESAITKIKKFLSNDPEPITEEDAELLRKVLLELSPSDEEKKRTHTLDSFYNVGGTEPTHFNEGDAGHGYHPADKE